MVTFMLILRHTPTWVWVLLAGLVALGMAQLREREVSLGRVTVLPLALMALSLSGVLSAFATPAALAAWAAGLALALSVGRGAVAVRGAAWSPETRRIRVPGSWLPLALILALFTIKYAVGVGIAMAPALSANVGFGVACGLAYGAFSGLFLARALSLRGLARGQGAAASGLTRAVRPGAN